MDCKGGGREEHNYPARTKLPKLPSRLEPGSERGASVTLAQLYQQLAERQQQQLRTDRMIRVKIGGQQVGTYWMRTTIFRFIPIVGYTTDKILQTHNFLVLIH